VARVDYEEMASSYDAGRDHPRERRDDWRRALAASVDRGRPLLDLGAGTGQWSGLLAAWFGVDVVAVEPSLEMRMRAGSRSDSRVHVVAGTGEHLPMRDGAVGTTWVSAVWHHLTDPVRVAAELARVLVPGGHLCVRGAFPDAGEALDLPTLRAFPEAVEVLATFPTIRDVVGSLERAGFVHLGVEGVTEVGPDSAAEAYRRASARADTLLRLLPDEVYQHRLADLRVAAQQETTATRHVARLPLLTFRKP
jgi:SAM-dependent methyltransferase